MKPVRAAVELLSQISAWPQVRMRSVQILVGTYSCGSMSIVVCSGGLRIHDMRHASPQARAGLSEGTLVLAIGQDWPEVSSGLPGEEAVLPASLGSRHLWEHVCHHFSKPSLPLEDVKWPGSFSGSLIQCCAVLSLPPCISADYEP